MMTDKTSKKSGQILLMSVMMLGGILLSATAIAGLLMKYQIRQTNDAANSAKALFAADAGLELESYCVLRVVNSFIPDPPSQPDCNSLTRPFLFDDEGIHVYVQVEEVTTNPLSGKREARISAEADSTNAIRAVETILPLQL